MRLWVPDWAAAKETPPWPSAVEDPAGAVVTNVELMISAVPGPACFGRGCLVLTGHRQTAKMHSWAFGLPRRAHGRAEQAQGTETRRCSAALSAWQWTWSLWKCSQVGKHRPRDTQNEKRDAVTSPKAAIPATGQAVRSRTALQSRKAWSWLGCVVPTPYPKAHQHSVLGN